MRLFFCSIIILYTISSYAQDEDFIKYGGYIEDTLTLEYRKATKDIHITNNNRLRLNIEPDLGENLIAGISLVGSLYAGEKSFNLVHYLPRKYAHTIKYYGVESTFKYSKQNEIWIQEAYGGWYWKFFKLKVGRQKIYSGAGLVLNPTDLFYHRNPLDPTEEVDGIDMISASILIGESTEIQGIYSFGSSRERTRHYHGIDDGDWQGKIKSHVGLWDISLFYTSALIQRTDYQSVILYKMAYPSLYTSPQTASSRWHMAAANFTGEMFGLGVRGEAGYVWVRSPKNKAMLKSEMKDHFLSLIGIDYTFGNQIHFMFEYMFDGQGKVGAGHYTLNEYTGYFNGERISLGKHTIYSGLRYPFTDFFTAMIYRILDPRDQSGVMNPWLIFIIENNLTLTLSAQVPMGMVKSQYGRLGTKGFLRLRYSF